MKNIVLSLLLLSSISAVAMEEDGFTFSMTDDGPVLNGPDVPSIWGSSGKPPSPPSPQPAHDVTNSDGLIIHVPADPFYVESTDMGSTDTGTAPEGS